MYQVGLILQTMTSQEGTYEIHTKTLCNASATTEFLDCNDQKKELPFILPCTVTLHHPSTSKLLPYLQPLRNFYPFFHCCIDSNRSIRSERNQADHDLLTKKHSTIKRPTLSQEQPFSSNKKIAELNALLVDSKNLVLAIQKRGSREARSHCSTSHAFRLKTHFKKFHKKERLL